MSGNLWRILSLISSDTRDKEKIRTVPCLELFQKVTASWNTTFQCCSELGTSTRYLLLQNTRFILELHYDNACSTERNMFGTIESSGANFWKTLGEVWAGHVERMGESRNVYRVLVGRPEGKRPLGRPRRRWEDNIKMDLREVGYDDRDWINLAQDRDQWRAYVRVAMKLRSVSWETGGKRPLGRPRRRWEDNIKMDLREVGYDDRDWRIGTAAYVRAAMNLRVP
ncbi:hypothetical protein ANN_21378 [Periplaneta americana]|uniref:Uncharacterized protein n=1 Tax=Periplaneta americana TaxID=6978 RepID=A0ABQ8SFZ2_PERAM|nr:hypothetical protein ANN_21378 [Periplaneta americana]